MAHIFSERLMDEIKALKTRLTYDKVKEFDSDEVFYVILKGKGGYVPALVTFNREDYLLKLREGKSETEALHFSLITRTKFMGMYMRLWLLLSKTDTTDTGYVLSVDDVLSILENNLK